MKIILVGATGTIGSALLPLLADHEVIRASRKGGDISVDITDPASIKAMYDQIGSVDAVISAAGGGAWKPLSELTDADFDLSYRYKLMGQVNLVRFGAGRVAKSFTLTSGVLAQDPMRGSAAISMINAGLEGFARAAALELAPVRVNVVSPPWVSETLAEMGQDPSGGMPAADVARSYLAALNDGSRSGQVLSSTEF